MKNFSFSSYNGSNNGSTTSSYETDSSGNEKYPKMKDNTEYYLYDVHNKPIFAKNSENCFYYAKDFDLNEFYPIYKKLSFTINKDGEAVIAHFKSGRERYPTDSKGNCYYLKNKEGKPFYLRDENGVIYPAKTKNNEYIFLEPPSLNKKHVRKKKDALNNTVYTCSPKINNFKIPLDVLCILTLIMSPLVIFASLMAL